jgi:hypothetical protein
MGDTKKKKEKKGKTGKNNEKENFTAAGSASAAMKLMSTKYAKVRGCVALAPVIRAPP